MTIVPGFIDCHNHAPGNVLLYEVVVGNPYVVEFVTIASIVDKLRAKARETPPGTWVEGYFFDDTKLKDNRQLNVHDLDQVSKDHPVAVHHRGGHTALLQQQGPGDGGHQPEHAESARRHLRPRRRGRPQRPRDRPRHGRAQPGRQAAAFTEEQTRAARPRRAGVHLQAVRALRRDQRPPRGRQSGGAAGGAGARRTAAPRELRSQRKSAGGDDRGRHHDRFSATSGSGWAPPREHTVDGSFSERTMALSTPYPGVDAAVQGQPHRDAGRPECLDRARAPRGHPGELPRQWRCGHRHGDDRGGARATPLSASGCAPEDHPLHPDQRRPGAAHQGGGRGAGAVHDVRLLQFRQVRVLRRRAHEALHGLPQFPGCRNSRGGGLRLQSGTVRPAHGHSGHGDAHRVGTGKRGAPTSGSRWRKRCG